MHCKQQQRNKYTNNMKATIDFKKENSEIRGGISIFEDGRHIAVTATTSRTFKSLNGAEQFMNSYSYYRAYF